MLEAIIIVGKGKRRVNVQRRRMKKIQFSPKDGQEGRGGGFSDSVLLVSEKLMPLPRPEREKS